MINLHYVREDASQVTGFSVYLLLQEKSGNPFLILQDDEILGELDYQGGCWKLIGDYNLDRDFVQAVGRFINAQAFSTLPATLRSRWPDDLAEVVVQSESDYLLVCKPERDFFIFERIFREFISGVLKAEGLFCFKVFDAGFERDFKLSVEAKAEHARYSGIEKWGRNPA